MQQSKILLTAIILLSSLMFVYSCAINPPVQEMSDARQALNAAKEAQAEKYANESYLKAQGLLEEARTYLENGDFYSAKDFAIDAKNEATLARKSSQNRAKEKQK